MTPAEVTTKYLYRVGGDFFVNLNNARKRARQKGVERVGVYGWLYQSHFFLAHYLTIEPEKK